jgi:hypothetical protein
VYGVKDAPLKDDLGITVTTKGAVNPEALAGLLPMSGTAVWFCCPEGLGHSQLGGLHVGPRSIAFSLEGAVAAGKEAETVDVGTWPEGVGQGGKPCDDLLQVHQAD